MKVILLKDVAGIGQKDDVKEVNVGYASNFLIPNRLAIAATKEALSHVERKQKEREAKRETALEEERRSFDALDGTTITIAAKANEQGHLFQKLDAGAIAAELEKRNGVTGASKLFELKRPIKETGTFSITIQAGKLTGTLTLVVEAQG